METIGIKKLTDRIYYLPHEIETDRPVLGYIKGDKYSLAIDAGNSRNHVEKFYNELRNANLRLPDYTIITHWHWDHTFGMHAVLGKTITGKLTNGRLKEVATWQWADEDMRDRLNTGKEIELCDSSIRLVYPNRNEIKVINSDIEFDNTLMIDLGGISCNIMAVEAPHSEDSVIIYIPEEKVIFVGDADCEDYYNNEGKYNKYKLRKYIDFIRSFDFNIYVISHDEPESRKAALDYLDEEYKKL